MATQKEFDEIMREKLQGLEADPSPRSWAAIQAEMGTAGRRRKVGAWWLLGVAAAVALLATATWLLWPEGSADPARGSIAHVQPGQEKPDSQPAPDMKEQLPAPAPQEQEVKQPQPLTPQMPNTPSPQQPGTLVEQNMPGKDSLLSPLPEAPAPQMIVEEHDQPILKDEPPSPIIEENMAQPLPTYADLAKPDKVSRGVLGAVTTGAREYLGINTSYYEQKEGDSKTTTFTADLKFFKITRVKKQRTAP